MDRRVQDQIIGRVRGNARRRVVTAHDFIDLASRSAVDQALSRLAKAGKLQRLRRGLYLYPRTNKRLGITVPPDIDDVASALARQTGDRIALSGAMAANKLGLSTQVPAKPVFVTDGRARSIKFGNSVIAMKHVAPRKLSAVSPMSVTVFQALRHIGKGQVTPAVVNQLRRALPADARRQLLRDARFASSWVADVARRIAADDSHG